MKSHSSTAWLPAIWQRKHHPLAYALAPLSWLFCALVRVRRFAYGHGLATVHHPGVPVVIVGNITTGGVGKTPLVIWLARFLQEAGFRPGIVVRGYGGKAKRWPQWVEAGADPVLVGDEAVLLARRARVPVVAGPDRPAAARELLAHSDCNLILGDDGLQHYALGRDVEIAVVDGVSMHGNGRCLPAGPLREPVSRLAEVDFVVVNRGFEPNLDGDRPGRNGPGRNEYAMDPVPGDLRPVAGENKARSVDAFRGGPAHAVCGIGHPERFFRTLRRLDLDIEPHAFPDHHPFQRTDLAFGDGLPVLMTEKDAVKCRRFAEPHHWYLPIDMAVETGFGAHLSTHLSALLQERSIGQKTA